jgi:hypothetical protein
MNAAGKMIGLSVFYLLVLNLCPEKREKEQVSISKTFLENAIQGKKE